MLKKLGVTVKNVIIDIDDVLVDCAGLLCDHFNQIGKQSSVDKYSEYNFPAYHGLTLEDLARVINEENVYQNVRLFDGVVDAINKLSANGYGIHLVTSRGAFEDAYNKTYEYLTENAVFFDTLSVIDSRIEKKSSAYKHLISESNELLIIDDNIDNLVDAYEHGVLGICVSQPWNKLPAYDFKDSPLWYFETFVDAVDAVIE